LLHARQKFLGECGIGQRGVPEAAIPSRAVDMGKIAAVEVGDAFWKRAAAVRQHLAPSRVPMRELDFLPNARDQICPRREVAVHQRLSDVHPVRQRLNRDAHPLFGKQLKGRVKQFAAALLGRKITLAAGLGSCGPCGGTDLLSTSTFQHGTCLARKPQLGNATSE
jgi:hypothetical protein